MQRAAHRRLAEAQSVGGAGHVTLIEEHREGRNEVEVCAQSMRELHVDDHKNAWDKSLHVWECRDQSEKESPR